MMRHLDKNRAPIRPFRIDIPQSQINDLRERINHTRWPDELPGGGGGSGWGYGAPLGYVKPLAEYWRDRYDWRKYEERLNEFAQFTTTIDGANVHFLHVRSPEPGAMPLLLSHGWPGSIVEFIHLIEPLTNPRAHGGKPGDAFHVVVPSIPGFGFSGPTREGGWDVQRVARAFATLMSRLGYERFGAHGGDFGAMVSRELGLQVPERIFGVHVLQLFSFPSGDPAEMVDLSQDEQRRLTKLARWRSEQSAYAMVQSTRPQTIAYSLHDSPVGQLAWIVDFFAAHGHHVDQVDRDLLLTNVMLYWLTGTAGSSARLYLENARGGAWETPRPSATPTGVAVFAHDFESIRRFAGRDNPRIVQWSEFERGGHFAALEQPELLIGDVRGFFRRFR